MLHCVVSYKLTDVSEVLCLLLELRAPAILNGATFQKENVTFLTTVILKVIALCKFKAVYSA